MNRGQISTYDGPASFREIYELLRLPVLLAALAIAGTWAVWYFTSASCTDELTQATGCNPSAIGRYISLDVLNKIMTHAVIAGGGGGLWSYTMTTRQRKVIESLEHQLAEERERAVEERERAAEERERFAAIIAEERERADEERERAVEERERAAQERERAAEERERAAEEREKAAEERRQLLALVESIRAQHNGNSESPQQA